VPEIVSGRLSPADGGLRSGHVNQPTGSLFSQYLSAIGTKRTT